MKGELQADTAQVTLTSGKEKNFRNCCYGYQRPFPLLPKWRLIGLTGQIATVRICYHVYSSITEHPSHTASRTV